MSARRRTYIVSERGRVSGFIVRQNCFAGFLCECVCVCVCRLSDGGVIEMLISPGCGRWSWKRQVGVVAVCKVFKKACFGKFLFGRLKGF